MCKSSARPASRLTSGRPSVYASQQFLDFIQVIIMNYLSSHPSAYIRLYFVNLQSSVAGVVLRRVLGSGTPPKPIWTPISETCTSSGVPKDLLIQCNSDGQRQDSTKVSSQHPNYHFMNTLIVYHLCYPGWNPNISFGTSYFSIFY